MTHGGPWNLANVEELVVAPWDNPILASATRFSRIVFLQLFRIRLALGNPLGEQPASQSWKRARNYRILVLVHFPAAKNPRETCRCRMLRRTHEFWRALQKLSRDDMSAEEASADSGIDVAIILAGVDF